MDIPPEEISSFMDLDFDAKGDPKRDPYHATLVVA